MIKIEIDVTSESSENLTKLAQYLMSVAGHEMVAAEVRPSPLPLMLKELVPDNRVPSLDNRLVPPPPADPVNPFAKNLVLDPPINPSAKNLVLDPPKNNVDSKGVTYDEKIHTKNKTKNKDGSWKSGRPGSRIEITKETGVEIVEENLLPEEDTFMDFMTTVGALIQSKKLTRSVLMQAASTVGFKSIEEIPLKPELIPAIKIELGKLGIL